MNPIETIKSLAALNKIHKGLKGLTMQILISALKSRTVWTIVALSVYNGIDSVKGLVSPKYQPVVEGVLVLMAIWFRINPKQSFPAK